MAIFGEVDEDFCKEAVFHTIVKSFVELLQSKYAKRLTILILQVD